MRFIFRVLSLVALVLAVISGTVDSVQSVADSDVVLTPFGTAWQDVSPATLLSLQGFVEHNLNAGSWNLMVQWVLSQPAFAVFLAIALLMWMIGYRKEPAAGRFAA